MVLDPTRCGVFCWGFDGFLIFFWESAVLGHGGNLSWGNMG